MQSNYKNFIGLGVAVITPFNEYKVDFSSLKRMIDHVIDGGVNYLVILGSTGEAATLSANEQKEILDFAIDTNRGRVPLVAGCFNDTDTNSLTKRLREYDFNGIDALLISSPSYVKPTQDGIFEHYKHVSLNSPLPVILYNVPGRTASNIQWQTTIKLAKEFKNIIGIKEASGNISQFTYLLKNKPKEFFVSSGDDESCLATTCLGGDGVISVIANAYPKLYSNMIKAALTGNLKEARKLNNATYPLHQYLYAEGNPTGIKGACNILGLCRRETRLPLMPISDGNYSNMKSAMSKIDKIKL